MIEEPTNLTVKADFRRPTAKQVKDMRCFPTGVVSDALSDTGALSLGIRFLGHGKDLPFVAVGPAVTADNSPGDLLGTLAAMKYVQKGDILISTVGAYQGRAAAGDLVMAMLKNSGVEGFITDGPMRDYAGIVDVGLPVWASGLNPASPFTKGPGRVGLPIQIGGREICSGDLIVADRDGVVVVPFGEIDAVVESCRRIADQERDYEAEIASGRCVSKKALAALEDERTQFLP